MAFEACDAKKRDLHEGCTNDRPRKRISAAAKQNMKESNISQEESVSVVNRSPGRQPSTSDQQLYKVVVCKRKAPHQALSPASRRKQQPRGWDMANKENEIAAGNLHDKLQNDRHTFLLNASDSSSSQTEGASSKYSGFFAEMSKDHDTMAQVLFSRNLRLNVALTFWRKRSVNELVAYLVRMQDLGVIADCLPVLTNRYVIVGLNWLQAIVKKWWTQLSASSEESSDENVLILKRQLSGMWQQESHLASVPGYTGNVAKDLDGYLSQLR
ncbi:KATNB1-like protein 1 isoform X2 [Rhinoderma darwinii]|uniref:KATNB1-like protein 1 isoform X2 n=1 Tax=Rhinoderma darwinii TaxID=43563 RepID=UPI003F672A88